MICNGEKILVGLSGGPDSLCLLHILINLRERYNISIYAAHINHMLRGKESFRDEEFSRKFCLDNNIEFFLKRENINLLSKELKVSIEEAGRKIRQEFFYETLKSIEGEKIALAHNLNDNGETIIMRVLRGTSLLGLSGIHPKRGNIIRPIIDCKREEIEKYCSDNKLNPVIDSTNLEDIYTRNKIRLKIIPYIRDNFNKNILENLHMNSKIAKDEENMLTSIVKENIIDLRCNNGYSVNKFNKLHIALKRRIIRYIIEEELKSLNGIEFKHINLIVNLLGKSVSGKSLDIKKGLILKIDYDVFNINKKDSGKKDINTYNILDKSVFISGYKVKGSLISRNELVTEKDDEKYFDFDKISKEVVVRYRKEGDYIYLKGLKGKKKLKDVFIDMKIPRSLRDKIPLVAVGNEILIIIGLRDSISYSVSEKTNKVFKVSLKGELLT